MNAGGLGTKNNLPKIAEYLQKEYPGRHTGIVVSSHMRRESYFGKQYIGSYISAEEAYSWYMKEGPLLIRGASEFLIQGIEPEHSIVSFAGDFIFRMGNGDLIRRHILILVYTLVILLFKTCIVFCLRRVEKEYLYTSLKIQYWTRHIDGLLKCCRSKNNCIESGEKLVAAKNVFE